MRKKLFVLLGDVVASRQIKDRDGFQRALQDLCEDINHAYAKDIYAPFKTLKGLDEIGGVLSDMSNIYNIIILISEHLHPCQMRCALVFDYVDTALESKDVSKMDGPAFHKAAQAVNDLKKTALLFSLFSADEILDRALQGEINLMLFIRDERTLKQRQIIKEYERLKNQQDVAKKLGISQQYVSLVLSHSQWKMLKDLEDELNMSLQRYQDRIIGGRTN